MTAIEISNLQKRYKNGTQALKGINLKIEEGDFFALLGPNGAGKSTAIGVISSLVNKTAGKVSVFGHDLDTDPEGVKSCIGLVPQEFNFNQFEPVAEIVINQAGFYGIPRKEAAQRAEQCLRQLELWDKRDQMARELSGGMKRRLMIARALVHRPRMLILDEPTAGVDIEIRRSMWNFLTEINQQGITIILTTHYLEEAESLCRNIAIINQGEIVKHSRMDRLLGQLRCETFVLDLEQSFDVPPNLPGFKSTLLDSQRLEIVVGQDQGINQLFSVLNQSGIRVTSLRNKQNRLEQLFIDLVETSRNGVKV